MRLPSWDSMSGTVKFLAVVGLIGIAMFALLYVDGALNASH